MNLRLLAMVKVGELVKKLREQRGWDQDELARRAGVSRASISAHENGHREPSFKQRCGYAKGFGFASIDEFDAAWHSDGPAVPRGQHRDDSKGVIPIINKTPAGPPHDYEDVGHDHYEYLPFSPEHVGDPDAFAVEVIGDSMEIEYHEGDIIVCAPKAQVESGDPCFIQFNGHRDAANTFKYVHDLGDGRIELVPGNRRHPTERVEIEHVGRIVKVIWHIQRRQWKPKPPNDAVKWLADKRAKRRPKP